MAGVRIGEGDGGAVDERAQPVLEGLLAEQAAAVAERLEQGG